MQDLVDTNFSEWKRKPINKNKVSPLFQDRNINFDKFPFSGLPKIIQMKGIQTSSAIIIVNQFKMTN